MRRKVMLIAAPGVAAGLLAAYFCIAPGTSVLQTQSPRSAAEAKNEHPESGAKTAGHRASGSQPRAASALPAGKFSPSPPVSREDLQIIRKLESQGISARNAACLTREDHPIPQEVFDHLSQASNWMPELQKAASSIVIDRNGEPSMLRIYDLDDDSVLRAFGIQEGDVVALIDGEIRAFEPSRAVEYARQAYSLITDLNDGEPVSVTVLRNGIPVNLVLQKW